MRSLFYLVRHGETYWNQEHKMQGQINIPLNERGREQARQAAKKLKNVSFDICYTSPLSRAKDTALEILKGREIPVLDEPLLLEQAYGLSEGASQKGFFDPASPLYGYSYKPEIYHPDIGAESFEGLLLRANEMVEKRMLPAEGQYERVLITAHGAILCGIMEVIQKTPLSRFWEALLPNCGAAVIELKDGVFKKIEFGRE